MQVAILIETIEAGRCRARAGAPFDFTVEGATRDEVLRRVEERVRERLRAGAEIVNLDIPATYFNALVAQAGRLDPNDPFVQEWEQEMANYRREVEADPNY
jgi:hypothetical protein